MKEKVLVIAKQKSTWFGIAAVIAAFAGLPVGSSEQIATLIVGVLGVVYPEKPAK